MDHNEPDFKPTQRDDARWRNVPDDVMIINCVDARADNTRTEREIARDRRREASA